MATRSGRHLAILRAPIDEGADVLRAAQARCGPPIALPLLPTPGAQEPLGSLRLGLLDRFGSPTALHSALSPRRASCGDTLANVAVGRPVAIDALLGGLTGLFEQYGRPGNRPWLILDSIQSTDPTSLEVLRRWLNQRGPDVFVVACVQESVRLPAPLDSLSADAEVHVEALPPEDVRALAGAILGEDAHAELARRVSALGGETPRGVLEAARTFIANGDLVREGDRFRWRIAPRAGIRALSVTALLQERIAHLARDDRRYLELVCALPPGSPRALVDAVAQHHGVPDTDRAAALARLEALRLLEPDGVPPSAALRRAVLERLDADDRAALCRAIAETLRSSPLYAGSLARATVGLFAADGGDAEAGATAVLEAAVGAASTGYGRSALRLAAAAVQLHPAGSTRAQASKITQAVLPHGALAGDDVAPEAATAARGARDRRRTTGSDEAEHVPVAARAVQALLDRDFGLVERCIDTAVARGGSLRAADRMRAMSSLLQGDPAAAAAALERAARSDPREADPRTLLAAAWVALGAGRSREAVRTSIEALACARETHDAHGEAAALHTLASCYRSMGREREAADLLSAAAG